MYPFNPNAIDCRLGTGKGEDSNAHEGGTKPSEGGGDQDETHSVDHGASEDNWRGDSDELGGTVLEEMHGVCTCRSVHIGFSI